MPRSASSGTSSLVWKMPRSAITCRRFHCIDDVFTHRLPPHQRGPRRAGLGMAQPITRLTIPLTVRLICRPRRLFAEAVG